MIAPTLEYRRFDRERRRQLRAQGVSLPVTRKAYRVTLTAMDVPEWARQQALKAVSASERHVWLRSRSVARELARQDRYRGGEGLVDAMEYRRCKRCRRLLLGREAAEMREAMRNGNAPRCGLDCR